MRTVDTHMLKPLGSEGAAPWLMDDGRLLRVGSGNHVIRTEDEARAMLETYRVASAAAGTPAGHETARIDGGFGVVVDYVAGVGLGMHVAIGSYAPAEAGRAMGELLRGLHGVRMDAGRDWNAAFRGWADSLALLLPLDAGERLVALVASIPECDCLLHGDFHVGNVVVSDGRLAVIDMEAAGFGHPAFDLAIARSRTLGNVVSEAERLGVSLQTAERAAHGLWEGLLEGYFEGTHADELKRLSWVIEVFSELERCCFDSGDERHRRERAACCAECLRRLSGRIGHLDWPALSSTLHERV